MTKILQATHRDPVTVSRLVQIWNTAVTATHTFLSPQDIQEIRADVSKAIEQVDKLYCYYDRNDRVQGFVGVDSDKIEMLFVDSAARGLGAGKSLLLHAMKETGAHYVDVNEQNQQGVGFYHHMGFETIDRDKVDSQGRPFPILHLKYSKSR